jgi:hypothetical protein
MAPTLKRSIARVSQRQQQAADLAFWLAQPMALRIAAVEELRQETAIAGPAQDAEPRLQRVCRIAQRPRR